MFKGRLQNCLYSAVFLCAGCAADQAQNMDAESRSLHSDPQALAINVGGPTYRGADGVLYQADILSIGGIVGEVEAILGSQDGFIYRSHRAGDLSLQYPLENGVYDITFKFAEPTNAEIGDRIFSISAEGREMVKNLDVKQARDGKPNSALVRTIMDIEVSDGQLNLDFTAVKGEPLLNALVVRKKFRDDRAWQLIWGDEFDYSGSPDASKWNIELWPARNVNDEDQAYTDREKNLRVEDGNLIIEAHKEEYGEASYTSGRIHSSGKGDFLYGRAEVRAKLPAGQGTWPAIWMLSSDPFRYATGCDEGEDMHTSSTCNAWPSSGEIDIMEHVGFDMNIVHGTVHTQAYYWKNWQQRKGSIRVDTVSTQFHTYAVEWTPTDLHFFVDDSYYFTYHNQGEGWEAWPFDHPYHLILNLAVGGMWGRAGGPIDDSIFPVRMEVDYVRVYQEVSEQH